MRDNVLILDCDGVIFDSIPLIDEYVKKIKYEASDSYKKELDIEEFKARVISDRLEEERSNDTVEYSIIRKKIKYIERKKKKHYEYKDLVLEEVLDEYKNRINYREIYKLDNTFNGVISMIYTIYGKGLFSDIYILSHVNCQEEINAKVEFFKNYLPMVKFIPVMFHKEPFYRKDGTKNNKRIRTNKMQFFKEYSGMDDLSNIYFIDDTQSIINEARSLGVLNAYFKNESSSTVDLLTKIAFDAIGIIDKKIK